MRLVFWGRKGSRKADTGSLWLESRLCRAEVMMHKVVADAAQVAKSIRLVTDRLPRQKKGRRRRCATSRIAMLEHPVASRNARAI